jgi:hypothetical protein
MTPRPFSDCPRGFKSCGHFRKGLRVIWMSDISEVGLGRPMKSIVNNYFHSLEYYDPPAPHIEVPQSYYSRVVIQPTVGCGFAAAYNKLIT